MSVAGNNYDSMVFGSWPQLAPVYGANPNPERMWVDPVNGSDFNNQSASKSRPLRTLGEAAKRIAGFPGAVEIGTRNANYILPAGGVFLDPRMLLGRVRVFADEEWDPTVYNPVVTGINSSSTKTSVVIPGFAATNSLRAMTVELTHGGVVERRTIRGNTNDESGNLVITPVFGFDAIAPGDAVRVLTNNSALFTPDDAGGDAYVFAADCPSWAAPPFNENRTPRLELQGLSFDSINGKYFALGFGRLNVQCFGLQFDGDLALEGRGSVFSMGTSFADTYPTFEGWTVGFTSGRPQQFKDSFLTGYLASVGEMGFYDNCELELYGGVFFRALNSIGKGSQAYFFQNSPGDQNVPFLFDASGTGSVAYETGIGPAFSRLDNVEILGGGAGVVCDVGTNMVITAAAQGRTDAGNMVFVNWGQGRIVLLGSPQLGDAVATDWNVAGSAGAVNKSFFSGAGQALLSLVDAGVIVQNS